MSFEIHVEVKNMPQKLLVPNEEYGSPSELLKWSKENKEARQAERFLAIRLLMLGKNRQEVMETYGIAWCTLQKWVKLWNKGGKEFLMLGKPTGRPTKLTQEAKDFIVKQFEFTDKRTGEKITAISISGVLEKKIQDRIKTRCDSLSSSQDVLQNVDSADNATSKKRKKSS